MRTLVDLLLMSWVALQAVALFGVLASQAHSAGASATIPAVAMAGVVLGVLFSCSSPPDARATGEFMALLWLADMSWGGDGDYRRLLLRLGLAGGVVALLGASLLCAKIRSAHSPQSER